MRDNVGFCWNAGEMDRLMDFLKTYEERDPIRGDVPPLIGGITPHDDYLYAGRIYYPLYPRLHAKEVVIFGVTHGTVRREIGDPKGLLLLDDFKTWTAPYGPVEISPLRRKLIAELDTSLFRVSRKAHMLEHSIEATIPFLQYYNRDAQIVPILVPFMPWQDVDRLGTQLADAVAAVVKAHGWKLGRDIAVLCSGDAQHYGDYGWSYYNYHPYGCDADGYQKAMDLDQRLIGARRTIEWRLFRRCRIGRWEIYRS